MASGTLAKSLSGKTVCLTVKMTGESQCLSVKGVSLSVKSVENKSGLQHQCH
jgi:hypothetical protein